MARTITYQPNYDRITSEVFAYLHGACRPSDQTLDEWTAIRNWIVNDIPVNELQVLGYIDLAEMYEQGRA
jgi:hypothetical protein